MKKIYFALSFLLILNCGSSKAEKPIKIKTFENEELTVSYPNSWIKSGGLGYVYFIPKVIDKSTFQNESEHVSVNKHLILIQPEENIENVLINYANKLFRSHKTKSFKLVKLESNSKFLYKIVSLITYKSKPGVYKREEYFMKKNGKLEYFTYQMRMSLFDQYHDDAMLIINSVKDKN